MGYSLDTWRKDLLLKFIFASNKIHMSVSTYFFSWTGIEKLKSISTFLFHNIILLIKKLSVGVLTFHANARGNSYENLLWRCRRWGVGGWFAGKHHLNFSWTSAGSYHLDLSPFLFLSEFKSKANIQKTFFGNKQKTKGFSSIDLYYCSI